MEIDPTLLASYRSPQSLVQTPACEESQFSECRTCVRSLHARYHDDIAALELHRRGAISDSTPKRPARAQIDQ